MSEKIVMSVDIPSLSGVSLVPLFFQGEERLSSPFSYKLGVFCADDALDPSKVIGQPLTVNLEIQGKKRFFNGIISHFSKDTAPTKTHYYFYVMPRLWFLTKTLNSQIFQNKTTIDIVEAVFKDFSFSEYETSGLKGNQREYCVQYQESAFDFVSRLLEEEGIFYFFKHEQGKHTLVFGDQASAYQAVEQTEIVYADGNLHRQGIQQWKHGYHFISGKYAHTDYNFVTPSTNLMTQQQTKTLADFKAYETFFYPGGYSDKSLGTTWAQVRMEEREKDYNLASGRSSYPLFSPGFTFKLDKHSSAPEPGGYALVRVSHNIHVEDEGRSFYENTFECIPDSVVFRPSRYTLKPVVNGPQTALVVGPEGDELYTDQYGRIKVKFFWDRNTDIKDEERTCWVRVMQTIAGNKWGHFFYPRIGQEVVVTFQEGNPDRPLIIGSVYNGEQMPPYGLPDAQTQSGIKTRSTKDGSDEETNELRFEDKKGSEDIYIHAQKEFHRVVEENDFLLIKKGNRTEELTEGNDVLTLSKGNRADTLTEGNDTLTLSKGDRTVTLTQGNDTLTLSNGNKVLKISQGNYTVQVSAGSISIEAMQGIELKVGQNSLKIGQEGITLTGMMIKSSGKMIQTSADAMLQLKGGVVMIN